MHYLVLGLILSLGLVPAPTGVTKADVEIENTQVWRVWVTAYSSSPDETDDTPNITAIGTETRDGIVATNMLPFGTKIKIPAQFGDKVFTVEDRMNRRMTNKVDVWMPSKGEALRFGSHYTEIVILEEEAK